MGLFGKMFGGRKQFTPILTRTQDHLFRIHGVPNPSDAQKIKACVYLCVSGMAILNDLGKGALNESIDRLVEDSKTLAKPFTTPVRDLANDSKQLKLIISEFPSDLEITEATKVNGLAGFEALYFALGEKLMNDILANGNGPMGIPGYAAVIVSEGLFGRAKAEARFMETSMEMLNFTKSIAEAN